MLNSLAACSSHGAVARASLVLVLMLSLLASWLIVPSIAPSLPAPQAPAARFAAAQPIDPRALPNDLANESEIVERRTANSATFRALEGQLSTIISAESMRYRDANGQWQVIDPAFQTQPDSFVVTHNTIESRAGQRRAWLSLMIDQTAFTWQADRLGVIAQGRFTSVAQTLNSAPQIAERSKRNRVLH